MFDLFTVWNDSDMYILNAFLCSLHVYWFSVFYRHTSLTFHRLSLVRTWRWLFLIASILNFDTQLFRWYSIISYYIWMDVDNAIAIHVNKYRIEMILVSFVSWLTKIYRPHDKNISSFSFRPLTIYRIESFFLMNILENYRIRFSCFHQL